MAKKTTETDTAEVKKDPRQQARDAALSAIMKRHGKEAIMKYSDMDAKEIEALPSGSIGLDIALGIGGYPRGRIIEIYGQEACLDGDSHVQYAIKTPDGRSQNAKGGTLRNLYHRFHKIPQKGQGNYQRAVSKDSVFYAPSMNDEGRIFQNRITDVVHTGVKECYELKTATGEYIVATADHKFYNGNTYVRLDSLNPGNYIFIHNNTPYTVESPVRNNRFEYMVKNHPVAASKKIWNKYTYYRLRRSRAVVEADMNGLQLEAYIQRLNEGNLEGLTFLPRDMHVHHLDEDHTNDVLSNLAIISAEEHCRLHAHERHNNLRFMAVPTEIVSITPVGPRETYDIKMADPFRNYVANKFVVHNCGKTTMMLHAIAECQKTGGTAAFVDAEHALDPVYASNLGVDMDSLYLSQPDNGEQALDIVEELVKSSSFDIVVVDSVAALVPKAEIEGEMGDSHMGLQARLMSQALRKLTGITEKSKTVLFFVNQQRSRIGVIYGSPLTTTGGNALKYYCSVRLEVKRTSVLKDGDDSFGNRTMVTVAKNKVAPPFKKAEFDILYGKGVNRLGEIFDYGVTLGAIDKAGAWYSWNGERIGQGRENALEYLRNNEHIVRDLEKTVYKRYKIGPQEE